MIDQDGHVTEEARSARLLIVDDQDANVRMLTRLLSQAGYRDILGATDPVQAVAMCRDAAPDLLLLDLHMPELDGFAVLQQLADRRRREHFPVLILTGDLEIETRRAALAAGADDFLVKPIDSLEALLRVGNLLAMRRLQRTLLDEKALLEEAVRERTADLELARGEVLSRLALATEYRDDATHEHAQRIGRTSRRLAQAAGAGEDLATALERAAPLHDIGKLAIPDAILLKPGPLDDHEFELMKTHTTIGADILADSRSPVLQLGEEVARSHHERWNGTGYPNGLAGEEIALSGRIVAVADVFDALTHARPYKEAWPIPRAVAAIADEAGEHFDPTIVDAFAELDHASLLAAVAG